MPIRIDQKTKAFISRCIEIDESVINHDFLVKYRRYFAGWQKTDFEKHIPRVVRQKIHDKWDLLLKEASETYSDLCHQGKIGIGGLIFPGFGGVYPSTKANYAKMMEKFK